MLQLYAVLVCVACLGCTFEPCRARKVVDPLADFHVEPSSRQLRSGDAYNVTCSFGTNSSLQSVCGGVDQLYMQAQGNENLTLHIVNATAVYHEVSSAQPKHAKDYTYQCFCRRKVLKAAAFMIGVRFEVPDFGCQFRDYEEQAPLECDFTAPPRSFDVDASTHFTLQHGRHVVNCSAAQAAGRMHCSVPRDRYNKFARDFNLTLRMFDKLEEQPPLNFSLSRDQCIILGRPGEQAKVLNSSSDAICLQWDDKQLSNHIGYNTSWSVELQPDLYPQTWSWRPPEALKNQLRFCLEHLPHPHYNYSLTIRRRYDHSSARWSEPFHYSFTTDPALPRRPPLLWPGGYHLNPHNLSELRVYWQQLHPLEWNGPHFTYNLSIYNNNNNNKNNGEIKHAQIEIEPNMAIIRNLNTQIDVYKFIIRSQNAVGMSENSSELVIDNRGGFQQRLPTHLNVSKIEGRLTWQRPEQLEHLLGYTVYWCLSNITDRSTCNETLPIESDQVDGDQCHYASSRTRIDAYQWAVSANYAGGSGGGGMIWLEWLHGSEGSSAPLSVTLHTIEGIVALLVLGTLGYLIIRKCRLMSDINVEMPEGVFKQQQMQADCQPEEMPLVVTVSQAKLVPLPVEIPLVLNGNFKPLDVPLVTPASAPAADPSGYISMQNHPVKEPTIAVQELPLKDLRSPNPAASGYVSMQSNRQPHRVTSDYVTPPLIYK